jgi:acetate---CoA ligase (ADP-forming)
MPGERPGAESIFLADSVAIVGASDSHEGFSSPLFENLRDAFAGRLFFINPRRTTIWGEPCYPDFAHVGQPIDLALVVVPGPAVPAILEEGAAHGLRAALLYNEAFAKPGSDEDRAATKRVRRLCAAPNGLRIAGPNSLGALSIARGGMFYPMRSMAALPAGNVGIVSASGGALQHWMLQAAARGLGFSYAVSTGNEIDLGLADYIEFLTGDEATRVICVIAEGVREPQAFARAAARALTAHKPIVILKAGRSAAAQRSVASHTGALAGDDDVFDAVCERYGIVRVASLDDLLEVALAFSRGRIPAGSGVAMLCHSGGIKGNFLDAAESEGLHLAGLTPATERRLSELGGFPVDNPLDGGMRLALRADEYGAVARAFADDPNVDIIALQGRLPGKEAHSPHKLAAYNELFDAIEKPIVAFERMAHNADAQTSAGAAMPFLHGIPQTVRALGALVRYGRALRAEAREPAAIEGAAPLPAAPPAAGVPELLRRTLAENGVVFPRETVVGDRAGAADAIERLNAPLVVKIASAELHKTELDAVRIGIRNGAELATAMDEIALNVARHSKVPLAPEFLVQEFVAGVELIAGVREDAQFGPVVVVGFGGTAAEVLRDVAIRLLPVAHDDVLAMLASLRGSALLGPFRGRPACDLDAVAAAVTGLGRTFLGCRSWLSDIELNPLIAGAAGAHAVDLRFAVRLDSSKG